MKFSASRDGLLPMSIALASTLFGFYLHQAPFGLEKVPRFDLELDEFDDICEFAFYQTPISMARTVYRRHRDTVPFLGALVGMGLVVGTNALFNMKASGAGKSGH